MEQLVRMNLVCFKQPRRQIDIAIVGAVYTISTGSLTRPGGITMTASGNLLISDRQTAAISLFNVGTASKSPYICS